MKLILSRKGFDSSAGGGPSPLLPDGSLLSLPIPSRDECRYQDVTTPDGQVLSSVLEELGFDVPDGCHLDPDLDPGARPRIDGWRPAFGSVGAAGRHLQDQGVDVGDLFLFFGWFRPARRVRGRLRFDRGPDLHVLFGYLRVGSVFQPGCDGLPCWLADHPHASEARRRAVGNTIYVAGEALGLLDGLPGAGLLDFRPQRVLTAAGMSRSRWRLPRDVFGGRSITYHSAGSWRESYFQSAARGQEFVMDIDPRVEDWVRKMLGG